LAAAGWQIGRSRETQWIQAQRVFVLFEQVKNLALPAKMECFV
jgi:hypothetical protein